MNREAMKEVYKKGVYTLLKDYNGSIHFYFKYDWCSRERSLEDGIKTIKNIIKINQENDKEKN